MNEPRHWEDYLLGSSDNPDARKPTKKRDKKLPVLEERIQYVQTVKKMNLEDPSKIDINRTNQERISYALDNRLSPVVKVRGKGTFYRIITRTEEGLIYIDYSKRIPDETLKLEDFK